jgi:hypothetical protein
MNGNYSGEDGTIHPTSDNSYRDERRYTPEEAAKWVGISSRRIRQLSSRYSIGSKLGEKYWTYTRSDLTLLDKLHRQARAKSVMRNVTPRDPQTAARIIDGQDSLFKYLSAQLHRFRQDAFKLVGDVDVGLHNRMRVGSSDKSSF